MKMIETTSRVANGSCATPASSASWRQKVGFTERRMAPVYAPSTGAVRPHAGDFLLIGAMTAAPQGDGLAWVHTGSPPD